MHGIASVQATTGGDTAKSRAVRWLTGVVVLGFGLWLSLRATITAVEFVSDGVLPWERPHQPLIVSLLWSVLAVGGFRAVLGLRVWSGWLAGALPLPAWGALTAFGWL